MKLLAGLPGIAVLAATAAAQDAVFAVAPAAAPAFAAVADVAATLRAVFAAPPAAAPAAPAAAPPKADGAADVPVTVAPTFADRELLRKGVKEAITKATTATTTTTTTTTTTKATTTTSTKPTPAPKAVSAALKAQATAAGARTALLVDNIKMDQTAIESALKGLQAAKKDIAPWEDRLKKATELAESKGKGAGETAHASAKLLKGIVGKVPELTKEAELKTIQMLKSDAAAALAAEGDAYARRKGWDKPANYGQVLANRAAEPFMKQLAAATQLGMESQKKAQEIIDQNRKARVEEEKLRQKADELEAEGDKIGALLERGEAKHLRLRITKLQKEAQEYKKAAADAVTHAPKIKEAAQKAAALASWWFNAAKTVEPQADA